jgi:hypothetical protein
LWPNASRALSLNGQEKSVAVIGATKSSLASAGAPGVLMRVAEPGNANTFGGSRDRQQNVAQNIAVLNRVALLNAEIVKSTIFAR